MKKKILVLQLLGTVAYVCAGGESGSASGVRASDMRGMVVVHPRPQYPQSSHSASQVQKRSHRVHDDIPRSSSAPTELSPVVEEGSVVPGAVPEMVSVKQKNQPRFLVPNCTTVSADDVKRTIDEVRTSLRDFKQGLREGNGRSHSFVVPAFVVPDDIVFNSWKAFRQIECYLGQVKECQDTCVQKKKDLPLCCADQKIFSQTEGQIARARQDMERLSQNRPGDKKKKLFAVIADIDAELYELDKLQMFVDGLEVRVTCCQQQLAKKSLRERLFGCWPKKAGRKVTQFEESCEEE